MSLTAIMAAASSGLNAAQTGLRVVSDNIANVNTPGYVRKQAMQTSLVSQGMGVGVDISSIRRAADTYLQGASLLASGDSSRASALSKGLDSAQLLFGDPTGMDTFFNKLEDIWTAFSAAADEPTSSLARVRSLEAVDTFLNDSARISNGLTTLEQNADVQITSDVKQVNDLLSRIQSLNNDIQRGNLAGVDISGSENIQSGLLDQLSQLMNVSISGRPNGGVTVRSSEGYSLAGDGAATLTYNKAEGAEGYITASLALGSGQPLRINVNSGEIKGLLELRNTELPGMGAQLGEITAKAAEEINRAANASSAVPPPISLTGRNTGLSEAEAFANFTGTTNLVITNPDNSIKKRVEIDFDAQTMSIDGGATTTSFASPQTFLGILNSTGILGGDGQASFTNGTLSVSANGSDGVAVVDDATDPSLKAGKGFSHFFGLNDIVRSSAPTTYATGMTGSSPHGFTSGAMTMRLMGPDGSRIRDISVTPTPGDDMSDVLTALNSSNGGAAPYGSFALNADGELAFTPANNPPGMTLSLVSDDTENSVGFSMSRMFGIGPAERGARAQRMFVDPAIRNQTARLPFAKMDITVAAGVAALTPGDGRGALAISQAGENNTGFKAAGSLASMNVSLSRYAMEMSGDIARKAAAAEGRKDAADAVKTEADAQRQSVEGVSLDEELINMTTFQQAYNASARLIQAAKDMYEVLTNLI